MPRLLEEGSALMELTEQGRMSDPATPQSPSPARSADHAAKAPKIAIKKFPVDKNAAPLFAT